MFFAASGKDFPNYAHSATRVVAMMAAALALLTPLAAMSAPPPETGFTYQGQLTEDGSPTNGLFDFDVVLMDAATFGSQVGASCSVSGVTVKGGRFTMMLNAGGEFGPTAFNGEARWLDIGVRAAGSGNPFSTLTPRQPLTATPNAHYALAAPWSGLVGIPAGFADGVDDNTTYSNSDGLVLVGTVFKADFAGSGVATTVARSDHNHFGQTWSGSSVADQAALSLSNGNSSGYGLKVDSLSGGVGVWAKRSGGFGITPSDFSGPPAVWGDTGGSGTGVAGTSVDGSGIYGTSTNYIGAFCTTSGTTSNKAGVYGYASNLTGGGFGVSGRSNGPEGVGVFGMTNNPAYVYRVDSGVAGYSANGAGVSAVCHHGDGVVGVQEDGTNTSGLYGEARHASSYGAFGRNTVNGTEGYLAGTYGVWGHGTDTTEAGYFEGNVHVTGTLTASSKDFRIDHPLDPDHQYLRHASIESSEYLNSYSGNVLLDGEGAATVALPDWFEALNGDYRYQLTAIGAPAPGLYVAEEIQNGQFKIAGGSAGLKVSWQVQGVRRDTWAKANPLVVEEAKPDSERGRRGFTPSTTHPPLGELMRVESQPVEPSQARNAQ